MSNFYPCNKDTLTFWKVSIAVHHFHDISMVKWLIPVKTLSTYAYQWFRCQGAMLNVSISWSSLMTMEFCPEGGRKWEKQMLHDDNNYVYITKGYDVQVDKVFRCLSCKLGWFDQLRRWVLNVTPPTTSDQHSLWELAIKIAYESMGNVSTEWNIVYWDCPDTGRM